MMAGNPNWWSMNGMHPQFSQFVYGSNISSVSSNPSESDHHPEQDFPVRSWSQLLLGGLSGNEEENRFAGSLFQQQKKLENWEDQVLNLNPTFTRDCAINLDVKQEVSQANSCHLFHGHLDYDHFQANNSQTSNSSWAHHQVMPVSSPTSCITNLSNSLLNFSGGKGSAATTEGKNNRHNQEHSSECNSTGTGGVSKKARVQQSSSQPALKVRKEKLGDRITALHQIVSPFGKTDTASVLSEAIGYIRFLQSQIEALSSPYMRSTSGNTSQHCASNLRMVQERNCLFHEEPSQESQDRGGLTKDLRSRGLCLVPISCTQHVGNDNIIGADYWAPPPPALGGGF